MSERLAVGVGDFNLSERKLGRMVLYAAGAGFLGVSLVYYPALGVGCALVGLVGGLIVAFAPPEERGFVGMALIAAFGLKIAVATLYQSYLFSGGYPIFAPDGEAFSKFGWYISRVLLGKDVNVLPSAEQTYWNYHVLIQKELHGVLPPVHYQTGVFAYFLGFLYAVFGYSPLLGRLINVTLSAVSAFLVMRVAQDQVGRRGGRLAFLLVLFWPSMFLFSLSLLRDTAVVLLIVLVVWSVHRFVRGTPLALAGALGGIVLIGVLRKQTAWLLVPILVLWGAYYFLSSRRALLLGAAVGVLVLGFTRMDVLIGDMFEQAVRQHVGFLASPGVNYSILPSRMKIDVEKRPPILRINTSDGKRVAIDLSNPTDSETEQLVKHLNNFSWGEIFRMYLRGVAHYVTEPWPSHLRSFKLRIFFPQMFLWYACLALAVPGTLAYWSRGRDMGVFIILFLGVFVSLYGLSEGTIGVLIRHRDMITPFVLLLAVVGFESTFGKKAAFLRR